MAVFYIIEQNETMVVEAPEMVVDCLDEYWNCFYEWLSDNKNEHGMWVEDCEGNRALCFGGEDFIEWVNKNINNPTDRLRIVKKIDGISETSNAKHIYI